MKHSNKDSYAKAYTEILEIINYMGDEYKNKAPTKLLNFFEDKKDKNYIYKISKMDENVIRDFSEKTKGLLTLLEYKYWTDDNEKELLRQALIRNEKNYQEEIRKKYNPDNIFKNKKV